MSHGLVASRFAKALSVLTLLVLAGCSEAPRSHASRETAPPQEMAPSDAHVPEDASAAAEPIVLDGRFADWHKVESALDEPTDDALAGSPLDLGPPRISHDDSYLHLLLDLGSTANLQALPAGVSIELWLDVDGRADTGVSSSPADSMMEMVGADAVVAFTTKQRGRPGMGVGLRSTAPLARAEDSNEVQLSPYDIGLAFAPTYASSLAEVRIERGSQPFGTPVWFTGDQMRCWLLLRASDDSVLDEVGPVDYSLSEVSRPSSLAQDLPSPAEGGLRIVNWNVQRGALFTNPAPFAATLRAIDPDVLLIQELRDTQPASMLQAWFDEHMPLDAADGGRWDVIVGDGGGDLRCAIVSRTPLSEVADLASVAFDEQPDRQLRIAGGIVQHEGASILLIATHLKCCGSLGSREDETRLIEVELLRRAVHELDDGVHFDGLVIAGDLNLVGGRAPLDLLVDSGDLDASDLAVAELLQLDGRGNATWHDANQPFVPGRLDWLVFSDSTLELLEGFVFDSRDLSPEALSRHELAVDATMASSDHFPLVADIRRRRGVN